MGFLKPGRKQVQKTGVWISRDGNFTGTATCKDGINAGEVEPTTCPVGVMA
jgi:hypothetical protein